MNLNDEIIKAFLFILDNDSKNNSIDYIIDQLKKPNYDPNFIDKKE